VEITNLKQLLNPSRKLQSGMVYYLINTKGKDIPIEASIAIIKDTESNPRGIVITFRDIGEKLRIEAERNRMEKHEALGYMAAGMAHDFNNLLGTILGSISLAQMSIAEDSEAQTILRDTEKVVLQG